MLRISPLFAAVLVLVGCNGANIKPGPAGPAGEGEPAAETAPPGQDTREQQAAAAEPAATTADARLDQLNGRLTLLQEQVIQLRSLLERQAEVGQMVLSRLEYASPPTNPADPAEERATPPGDAVDDALNQLLQVVNQLGFSEGGDQYAVATTYTARGAWILLRYRTDTGETWLADNGGWIPLEEEGELYPSRYRIQLSRADQDLKGYVAVRIDQQSGQAWWLNDRLWQVYQ